MSEPADHAEAEEAPRPAGRSKPAAASGPNYAARRMLASTIAITAVVAAGLAAWRLTRGGDDDAIGAADRWDRIALVDRATGAVTIVDESAETVATTVGSGRVTAVHARGEHLALVGPEQVVVHPDHDEPLVVPTERGDEVAVHTAGDTFHLVVGPPAGGNVTVIDAITEDVIDLGALTEQASPLLFADTYRSSLDGSAFAIADARFFRTIVVRQGEPAATYFPDQPVAVSTEIVATSQVIDREADVTLSDAERRPLAVGTVEIPAGGVIVDDELIVVATDGTISRLGRDDEDATRIGAVSVPTGDTVAGVHPIADGDRLVVFGTTFEAVVDLDGTTVFTTTFTNPVDVAVPEPRWRCLPVGGAADSDAGYHSLISVASGEQLADLTGLAVTGAASDGCTVIGERDGVTEIVGADGSVRLGPVRAATLGPDGRAAVVQTASGATQLLAIGDDLSVADPVDLDAGAATNPLVAFLAD